MKDTKFKFRVWDKALKRWSKRLTIGQNGLLSVSHPENYVITSYIGLKDKNGVDIYEGDVVVKKEKVETDEMNGLLWNRTQKDIYKFNTLWEKLEPQETNRDIVDTSRFRAWLQNESFGYEGEDLQNPDEYEIIGNIYENPELLKDK